MKRLFSLLMAAALLLGFAACGSDLPPTESNEPSSTLMTVATDLANEVDSMPLYSEALATFSSGISSMNADDTTPIYYYMDDDDRIDGDGIFWHEDHLPEDFDPTSTDSQYSGLNRVVNFNRIDNFVNSIKTLKADALATCKELDVWVEENPAITLPIPPGLTPTSSNYRYRIHYDVNADVVTVETLHDNYSGSYGYSSFSIGYNIDHKMKVDGYSLTVTPDEVTGTSSVHYLEDSYYVSVFQSKTESEMTVTDIQTKAWAKIYPVYNTVRDENGNVKTVFYCMEYLLSYDKEGYTVELTSDGGKLYFPNQRFAAEWSGIDNYYFSIEIFDNWEKLESSDNNSLLTLTTPKGDFYFYPNGHPLNPEFLNREGFYFNLSYAWQLTPLMMFKPSNEFRQQDIHWTRDDAKHYLNQLAEHLGVTVRTDVRDMLFSVIEEKDEKVAAMPLTQGFFGCEISREDYESIVNNLAYNSITHSEIMKEIKAPIKAFKDQNPEYAYFEFLDFSMDGAASFDTETNSLNLSTLTASIEPSVLLNEGEAYRFTFVFVSDKKRSTVAYKEATYDGTTLKFSGEKTIQREGIPSGDTPYVLKCYLTDSRNNRISKIYTVEGNVNAAYDLSTESRHITLTLSADRIFTESYPIETEE